MSGPEQATPPRRPGGFFHRLSRRQLFSALFGSAVFGTAYSLVDNGRAQAQPKTSKKVAKYQTHPHNGQHCQICRYFKPPHSCQLVAGTISPNGWCSFFAKKT